MKDLLHKGILYYFLLNSAIVALVFLISVLKPHRLYKKLLSSFFNMTFKYNKVDWKVYNILLVIIGFYSLLFAFLQMTGETFYESDSPMLRMEKLGRKWQNETNLWMVTLIIICLVSVYRNAQLFSQEVQIKKEIEETEKQIEMTKTKQ